MGAKTLADDVDISNDIQAEFLALGIAAARQPIAKGEPGECWDCGTDSPRLVNRVCARCRDRKAKLYARR